MITTVVACNVETYEGQNKGQIKYKHKVLVLSLTLHVTKKM